eukprot:gb/GFBE01048640.1/.p1 GENE.gb/GFBE01048640.1/~~gb/GFBE01048640.1/.p1  ORF type:complete len:106 (+),score=9.91 gb/GFBE01048640.1/:1-318(+)
MSCADAYFKCGWQLDDTISPDDFPPMWVKGCQRCFERDLVLKVFGQDASDVLQQAALPEGRSFCHPLALGNVRPEDVHRRAKLEEAGYKPIVGTGVLRMSLQARK